MNFNGLNVLMAAGMVASPAVSAVVSMGGNVVMAKENTAATLENNFFLSFVESTTTPQGFDYKDGVLVFKNNVDYVEDKENSKITLSDSKVTNLKEGDIFVMEQYGDTGKAFKVVSVTPVVGKYEIKYSDPELHEFLNSLNVSSVSAKDVLAKIKDAKSNVEKAASTMKDAGFSPRFIELMQSDFAVAYADLFSDINSINIEDETAAQEYIKSIDKKLADNGYKTDVVCIADSIGTLSSDKMSQKVKKLKTEDIKLVNKSLDSFMDVYETGHLTSAQKKEAYETFIVSLKEAASKIEKNNPDTSDGDNTTLGGDKNTGNAGQGSGTTQGGTTTSTDANKNNSQTADSQVGDFEKELTLVSAPAAFDSTTLKTHTGAGFEDTSKNHEYQYYEVSFKGEDGQEIKMMALANNDNLDALKGAKSGDTMVVNYTVSKCVDGSYDYVINKMSKKGATADVTNQTTTGENANTGIQRNGIYYVVGLGVAAAGIGALVYTKKKKEEK